MCILDTLDTEERIHRGCMYILHIITMLYVIDYKGIRFKISTNTAVSGRCFNALSWVAFGSASACISVQDLIKHSCVQDLRLSVQGRVEPSYCKAVEKDAKGG